MFFILRRRVLRYRTAVRVGKKARIKNTYTDGTGFNACQNKIPPLALVRNLRLAVGVDAHIDPSAQANGIMLFILSFKTSM